MPPAPDPYTFVTADLLTGAVIRTVQPASATWERKLNAPGSATLTFHIDQFPLAVVEPNLVAVYILRDDHVLFAGWVTKVSANGGSRTAQVGLTELTGYLYRRSLRSTRTYAGVPQVDIVANLIDYTNANDGIGLAPVAQLGSVGITRDRAYEGLERHNVGTLIENLTGVIGGPDYELRVRSNGAGGFVREVLIADSLGRALPLVYEAGVNLSSWSVNVDGDEHANRVDATGAGQGPGLLIATAQEPVTQYPRFDGVTAYRSVTNQSTLAEYADGDLARLARPILQPAIQMAFDDIGIGSGSIRPGDTFRVTIDDGMAQFDDLARLIGWKFDYTVGKPPGVVFDVVPVRPVPRSLVSRAGTLFGSSPSPRTPSLFDELTSMQRRLAALERPAT